MPLRSCSCGGGRRCGRRNRSNYQQQRQQRGDWLHQLRHGRLRSEGQAFPLSSCKARCSRPCEGGRTSRVTGSTPARSLRRSPHAHRCCSDQATWAAGLDQLDAPWRAPALLRGSGHLTPVTCMQPSFLSLNKFFTITLMPRLVGHVLSRALRHSLSPARPRLGHDRPPGPDQSPERCKQVPL